MGLLGNSWTGATSVWSQIVRLLAATVVYGAMLFVAAGTIRWPSAWAYVGIFLVVILVYTTIVVRLHPDLIAERTRPPADAEKWDKPLVAVVGAIGPFAIVLVSAFDHRYGWTDPLPAWMVVTAGVAVTAASMFTNWAVASNRFFSAIVRIQRDRGHHVVDGGPYRLVRHPGYAGSVVVTLCTPILLGSLWGLGVSIAVLAVLVVRTIREDRTLQEKLEGYRAYAARVRWRLIPGVW